MEKRVVEQTSDISRECVETAYSFMHQKQRIYAHSTLAWQRDDIEVAIASYVDDMNPQLYAAMAGGRTDYLRDHTHFADDITRAVELLEGMLSC
jgi:hypothetical protein